MRQKAAVDGGRDEGRRALVSAASAVGAEFLEAEVAFSGKCTSDEKKHDLPCAVALMYKRRRVTQ